MDSLDKLSDIKSTRLLTTTGDLVGLGVDATVIQKRLE